jgi:hypothetical protein
LNRAKALVFKVHLLALQMPKHTSQSRYTTSEPKGIIECRRSRLLNLIVTLKSDSEEKEADPMRNDNFVVGRVLLDKANLVASTQCQNCQTLGLL